MSRADPLKTLPTRFGSKLRQDGDCWVWTGGKSAGGYGHISMGKGVCRLAHRISWELHRGPIPDGLQIDHLCRNRACVNPDHLEPVPPALNTARSFSPAALNAEKERCVRGHELTGTNIRLDGASRVCLRCRNIRQRESRAPFVGRGPGSGSSQRAKTSCPQGHPYDDVNTYVSNAGRRNCRECSRARRRQWYAQKQAGAAVIDSLGAEPTIPGAAS